MITGISLPGPLASKNALRAALKPASPVLISQANNLLPRLNIKSYRTVPAVPYDFATMTSNLARATKGKQPENQQYGQDDQRDSQLNPLTMSISDILHIDPVRAPLANDPHAVVPLSGFRFGLAIFFAHPFARLDLPSKAVAGVFERPSTAIAVGHDAKMIAVPPFSNYSSLDAKRRGMEPTVLTTCFGVRWLRGR